MMVVPAHQGGWDEVLVVLVPMAILAVLVWLTSRRAAGDLTDDDRPGRAGPDEQPD